MKKENSGMFMIAAGTLVVSLGFLGYRKMSGDRKRSRIMKGENRINDKTSVELSKTEDNIDPVLAAGQDEIRKMFKTIIINMVFENRQNYKNIFSFEDFLRELITKTQGGFLFNQEALNYLSKITEGMPCLIRELKYMKLLSNVELLINENRLRHLYREDQKLEKEEKGAVVKRPLRVKGKDNFEINISRTPLQYFERKSSYSKR